MTHMGWWENQHGKQLRIAATATFASLGLVILSAAQLLVLQDFEGYEGYTEYAIVLIVIGVIGLSFAAPQFANLSARAGTIKSIMQLNSASELRKHRSDGDEAARILGGGHEETWNNFLIEKGLKKR